MIEENQVNKTEKESKDEELKRVRELMESKSKDLKEKEKDGYAQEIILENSEGYKEGKYAFSRRI